MLATGSQPMHSWPEEAIWWVNDSDLVVGDDIVASAVANARVAHAVRDLQVIGLWRVTPRVVGSSRPFVWSVSGGMKDLNTLIPQDSGVSLTTASGIDEAGEIVGAGVVSGPAVHGYMLVPGN